MRLKVILTAGLAVLLLAVAANAQDKNLLSLATDLGAVLEWDPLRDVGVLVVGADSALVNYRLKVAIEPPVRRNGAVWLSTGAVTAISAAVQSDRLAHAGERMRVACILIDAGHGGKDGGGVGSYAAGKASVTLKEKDVTLSVARALGGLLKSRYPDKQVLFTRNDDTFVSLEDRVVIANKLLDTTRDTVLYISVHANISPFNKDASGFEVWCLPPTYQRKLLDEKSTGKDNIDILPILNSMLQEEISMESTVLAQEILKGLDVHIGQKSGDRGLRQNDWYVVRNTRMPAVLTEVGFVSNPDEAARLADPAYLNDVAEGMYTGIDAFIARFERNGSAGAR